MRISYKKKIAEIRNGWVFIALKTLTQLFQWIKSPAVPYFGIFNRLNPQPYFISAFSMV